MFIDRIDEFEEILEELCSEIPEELFQSLNGGVIIEEEVMYHPMSKKDDIICLGVYKRDMLGNSIIMYYGSFMEMYWDKPGDEFKELIKHTLYHEFTHHLEYLSGERGLEIKDEEELERYIRRENE